jgi:hypothetical protein
MKTETPNPTDINPENDCPEPFASVMELVEGHGIQAVLECLADLAGNFSGEEAAYLHQGLYKLLAEYNRYFPVPGVGEEQPPLFFLPAKEVVV